MKHEQSNTEMNNLRKAFEVEKAHLEYLFEGLQEAIVLVDNQGMIQKCNRAFETLFGYSAEEVLGRNLDDLVAPGEFNDEARSITTSVLSGSSKLLETVRRMKDGTLIDVSILAAPVTVEDSIVGHYAIYRDISESKRADHLLNQEKAYLEHLFEGLQEAIVLVDNEGVIRRANKEFETLFGHSVGDALGRNIDDLIAPGELHKEARLITDSVISGGKQLVETVRKRKDGSHIDVSVLASPISVDGSQEGYYGIYRDISESKRAAERLAMSRWRIEMLHSTARKLDSCVSEKEVYHITLTAASEILDFNLSSISTVRKDGLVPSTFSSPAVAGMLKSHRFTPGKDLAGKSFMERRTLLSAQLPEEHFMVFEADGNESSLLIASPIGEYGVFTGFGTEDDLIDDEQVTLLELLLSYSSEAVKRIRLLEELRNQAIHDPLTGLFNRNFFKHVIQKETERSIRYHHSIGIVMVDINRFKDVNDRYGHQRGDEVLKQVATSLNRALRKSDAIIRYGGDEFLIILPESKGDIQVVIQRLREVVSGIKIGDSYDDFSITLSIGAVLWKPGDGISIDSALSEADALMYVDKKSQH